MSSITKEEEEAKTFNTKLRSLLGACLTNPIRTDFPNRDACVFVHLKREASGQVSISQLRLLLFVNFVAKLTGKK